MNKTQRKAAIDAVIADNGGGDKITPEELNAQLKGIVDDALFPEDAAAIKSAYESNADTNAFSNAEKTKLLGIEANATADMTAGEIKTAYENNANTNAFTDAEQTKLAQLAVKTFSNTSSLLLSDTANTITGTIQTPVFVIAGSTATLDVTHHNSIVFLNNAGANTSQTITLPNNITNFIVQIKVKSVPSSNLVNIDIDSTQSFDTGTLGITETVTTIGQIKRIQLPVGTDLLFVRSGSTWYVGNRAISSAGTYPAGRYVIPNTTDQTNLQNPSNWSNDNYTGTSLTSFPVGSFWYNNLHTFENTGTVVRNSKSSSSGGGDMLKATYDPTNINNSAFDLAYHTGTLDSSRIGYTMSQLTYNANLSWNYTTLKSNVWLNLTNDATLAGIANAPASGIFYMYVITGLANAKINFAFPEGHLLSASYPTSTALNSVVEVIIHKISVNSQTKWIISCKQLTAVAADTPPVFTDVTVTGSLFSGATQTVTPTYFDANGDNVDEAASTFQIRAYDTNGDALADQTAINAGADPAGGTLVTPDTAIKSIPFTVAAPAGLISKHALYICRPVSATGGNNIGIYRASNIMGPYAASAATPQVAYSTVFDLDATTSAAYSGTFDLATPGSNYKLFAWVAGEQGNTTTVSPSGCTIGGNAATVVRTGYYNGGNRTYLGIYELPEASFPADGTGLTCAFTLSGNVGQKRGGIILVSDANQSAISLKQLTSFAGSVLAIAPTANLTAPGAGLLLTFFGVGDWYPTFTPTDTQTILHVAEANGGTNSQGGTATSSSHVSTKEVNAAGSIVNTYTKSHSVGDVQMYEVFIPTA